MGLTKVFVGNLSFKTKDSDLASEFSSAGKVVSANIITRGPRSLGYGFVELESEEEAQKAVVLMNKKCIDTRDINVELARPRDEARLVERRNNPNPRRGRGRGRGGRGGRGMGRGLGGGAPGGGGQMGAGAGAGAGEGSPGNGGGAQVGGAPGPNQVGGGQGGPVSPGGSPGRGNFRGRRYRPRGDYSVEVGAGGGDVPNNNVPNPGPRGRGGRGRGRGGRGRGGYQRPYVPREPSKTTLYVANLPFSVEDDALANLFKDLKSTKAYVVRAKNSRSKGFGFVEFANEEDQKAALTAAESFTLGDRNLIVKVAMTENRPDDVKDNNNDTAESQAPEQEKNENQQQIS